MNDKTYAVVKLSEFTREKFSSTKLDQNTEGKSILITTKFDTIRKSLDGSLGILSWKGERAPQGISPVFRGNHDAIVAYLEKNEAAWSRRQPADGAPRVVAVSSMDSETRPAVESRSTANVWKWAAAVAAAGLAYAVFHFAG